MMWLRVIGISGGLASSLVMLGTMVLLTIDPTPLTLGFGLEYYIEIPLMALSVIVMLYLLFKEIDDL